MYQRQQFQKIHQQHFQFINSELWLELKQLTRRIWNELKGDV